MRAAINPQLDYFTLAVTLARTEAVKKQAKRTAPPCHCAAYSFPHRAGSKACAEIAERDLKGEYDSCPHCSGTGEGTHDGVRCGSCGGSGGVA